MIFYNKKTINIFLLFILISCGSDVKTSSDDKIQDKITSEETLEQPLESQESPQTPDEITSEEITSEENSEKLFQEREDELNRREKNLSNRIKEVDNKEIEVNARIKEVDNKEIEVNARIKEVDNKEIEVNARIKEVDITEKKAKELISEARLKWLKEMAIYIILFLSIVAALFLSVFLKKIYTWRKKVDGNAILLPEQIKDDIDNGIDKNHKDIHLLIRKIGELSNISTKNNNQNSKYFDNINEALTPLKDTIASQRDEIQRLQKGYDNHIKKSFVRRLIDLRGRISFYTRKENKNSPEVIDATNNILKILDYMFKTENIKTMTFDGLSLNEIDSDEVDILEENAVNTKDNKLAGRVKETLSLCYYLEGNDGKKEVISKGLVTFYKK